MKTIKFIAAVFIGLMVAFTIIILLEKVAHGKMIVPEGLDPNTPEGAAQLISQSSISALIWIVIGYLAGSFVGSMLAQLISNGTRAVTAYTTGLILLALALVNLTRVPHPLWMIISCVIAVLAGSWLGGLFVRKKNAPI